MSEFDKQNNLHIKYLVTNYQQGNILRRKKQKLWKVIATIMNTPKEVILPPDSE